MLTLAITVGYALLSGSDLEAGWRSARPSPDFWRRFFSGIRWFLPEVQIPEEIVEKKVALRLWSSTRCR